MSGAEELLSEIIALQRELLSNLKLEEQSLLDKDAKLVSAFHGSSLEMKKKIRALKLKFKKSIDESLLTENVEYTTLKEQQESLDKKIKEMGKSNKKILSSHPTLTLLPEDKEDKKRHLLLEEDSG